MFQTSEFRLIVEKTTLLRNIIKIAVYSAFGRKYGKVVFRQL